MSRVPLGGITRPPPGEKEEDDDMFDMSSLNSVDLEEQIDKQLSQPTKKAAKKPKPSKPEPVVYLDPSKRREKDEFMKFLSIGAEVEDMHSRRKDSIVMGILEDKANEPIPSEGEDSDEDPKASIQIETSKSKFS